MTVEITYEKPSPIVGIKATGRGSSDEYVCVSTERLMSGFVSIAVHERYNVTSVTLANPDAIAFAKALIEMVGETEASSDE